MKRTVLAATIAIWAAGVSFAGGFGQRTGCSSGYDCSADCGQCGQCGQGNSPWARTRSCGHWQTSGSCGSCGANHGNCSRSGEKLNRLIDFLCYKPTMPCNCRPKPSCCVPALTAWFPNTCSAKACCHGSHCQANCQRTRCMQRGSNCGTCGGRCGQSMRSCGSDCARMAPSRPSMPPAPYQEYAARRPMMPAPQAYTQPSRPLLSYYGAAQGHQQRQMQQPVQQGAYGSPANGYAGYSVQPSAYYLPQMPQQPRQ